MYDRVLVITINSYYSKIPSIYSKVPSIAKIVPRYFFSTVPVPRYNFSKVPGTGTAVLLKNTVPISSTVNICESESQLKNKKVF